MIYVILAKDKDNFFKTIIIKKFFIFPQTKKEMALILMDKFKSNCSITSIIMTTIDY
jgi:hypothetical protein